MDVEWPCRYNLTPSIYSNRDDFFLISQSVSQGTVGPTHYVIVHAGVQALTKERLYMLTYKLCHMYYNWLVSINTFRYSAWLLGCSFNIP